jgi:hypothetical protein
VTSLLAHGIWLTLVLGHSSVDGLNDIRSDGRGENLYNSNQLSIPSTTQVNLFAQTFFFSSCINRKFATAYLWERVGRAAGSAIGGQNGDSRTGGHLDGLIPVSWLSSLSIRSWRKFRCRKTSLIFWNWGVCLSENSS